MIGGYSSMIGGYSKHRIKGTDTKYRFMYICIYGCYMACVRVCVCVCVCVCTRACIHTYMYAHIHTNTHTHTHTRARTHTHTRTNSYTHTHVHPRTHTCTPMHAHMHTYLVCTRARWRHTCRQGARQLETDCHLPALMAHIYLWMSHGTHIKDSWYTHKPVTSHVCMSHGTRNNGLPLSCSYGTHVEESRMDESCHTYEWVMLHIWMSHVTHMNESWRTYEWVRSHTTMSHVTRMHESWHTYQWVVAHILVIHDTYINAGMHDYLTWEVGLGQLHLLSIWVTVHTSMSHGAHINVS